MKERRARVFLCLYREAEEERRGEAKKEWFESATAIRLTSTDG